MSIKLVHTNSHKRAYVGNLNSYHIQIQNYFFQYKGCPRDDIWGGPRTINGLLLILSEFK